MGEGFKYSFRFCTEPDFNDEREIESLVRFVQEADIDDVSVFCNVEEINRGHMTKEEQKRYLKLISDVRDALPKSVTVSVNHWHSLMHADLGKKLKPGQDFRLMVDKNGKKSDLCVCPLCENWQEYFINLYREYARLNPNILWIEDDFRLHNHDPLEWGGCFCEAHMREFSKRAGKELTREEFLEGVLKPGKPHPYRKIWLDVNRECFNSLAKKIGDAIHSESPDTKLGLMSSVPFIHSAEGRDWKGILKGLAADNPPVNRIHLPGYSEMAPKDLLLQFNMVSMHTRAFISEDTLVYPELENYPYSLFSKSRKYTRFQLSAALALGLKGITIDLFDLNGNGIVFSEDYQGMLREIKPYLNKMTEDGVFFGKRQGIKVMTCEDSSYSIHTKSGDAMEELYPSEVYFAGVLPAFGIPFDFCTDKSVKNEILAIGGQFLRNLSEKEIRDLFNNNFIIISGDAIEVLYDMGLGELCGIARFRVMKQNGGEYTYEEVENGLISSGIKRARASAVISSADAVNIEYSGSVMAYTGFYNSFHERACPGHALVNDKVLVYPFCNFDGPNSVPHMQLNPVRRDIVQDAIMRFGGDFPMVVGEAYVFPYVFTMEGKTYIFLVNSGHDDIIKLRLYLPEFSGNSVKVLKSDCDSRIKPVSLVEGLVVIDEVLPGLDTCLIEID